MGRKNLSLQGSPENVLASPKRRASTNVGQKEILHFGEIARPYSKALLTQCLDSTRKAHGPSSKSKADNMINCW